MARTYFEQIAAVAATPSKQEAIAEWLKNPVPDPVTASKVISAYRAHMRALLQGAIQMAAFERSTSVDARDAGKGVRMAFTLMYQNDSMMLAHFRSLIDLEPQPQTSKRAEDLAEGARRGDAAYQLMMAAASGVQTGLIDRTTVDPVTKSLTTLAVTQAERDSLVTYVRRALPQLPSDYGDHLGVLLDGPKALLRMLSDANWRTTVKSP